MSMAKDLLSRINAHSEATGLPGTTITKRAVGASQLYRRLSRGEGCTIRTAERVLDWLDRHAGTSAPVNEDNARVTGLQPQVGE